MEEVDRAVDGVDDPLQPLGRLGFRTIEDRAALLAENLAFREDVGQELSRESLAFDVELVLHVAPRG